MYTQSSFWVERRDGAGPEILVTTAPTSRLEALMNINQSKVYSISKRKRVSFTDV